MIWCKIGQLEFKPQFQQIPDSSYLPIVQNSISRALQGRPMETSKAHRGGAETQGTDLPLTPSSLHHLLLVLSLCWPLGMVDVNMCIYIYTCIYIYIYIYIYTYIYSQDRPCPSPHHCITPALPPTLSPSFHYNLLKLTFQTIISSQSLNSIVPNHNFITTSQNHHSKP